MKNIFIKAAILGLLIANTLDVTIAQDTKAYEVMKKNDELTKPKDSYSEISLVLKDSKGRTIQRTLKSFSLKTNEGYNSFIEVLSPADIAGMRLLSLAKQGEDDQRLYLPSFGKSRKISSSGKTGKFLGSDIYFYDLEDHDLDEFNYKFIGNKTWNGKDFFVIESVPKDKNAPYSKTIHWVSSADFFIYKSEMYDKNNRLLKTLIVSKTKTQQNIIVPWQLEITNSKDRHSTLYQVTSNKINPGVDANTFSVKNLEK